MLAKIAIFLAIIIGVLFVFRFIKDLQGRNQKLDRSAEQPMDPVSVEKCDKCEAWVQPGKRCGKCGTLKS